MFWHNPAVLADRGLVSGRLTSPFGRGGGGGGLSPWYMAQGSQCHSRAVGLDEGLCGDAQLAGVTAMRLSLLTALAMIAFAGNSVLNRMAVGQGLIGPLEFAVVRLVAGAVVLAGLVLLRRGLRGGAVWPGGRGRLPGVVGLLVYLLGFSLAYQGIAAGPGALILFGVVQITMFAGAVLASERVPPHRWLGAALSFGGLVVLLLPGAAVPDLRPVAAMAVAGVGWGVYSLAGRGQADALAATAANFVLALPVMGLVLLALPVSLDGTASTPTGLMLAVLSGAVTSGLGYALWYGVLPALGAGRAAVAQLTVPVIAALGGAMLLGEAVGMRFGLASVLVLGGVALASRQSGLRRR